MSTRELQSTIVQGLQKIGGRGTLGDLMSATALGAEEIRQNILGAISGSRGHVEVDENGELVYSLAPTTRPVQRSWYRRLWRATYALVQLLYFTGLLVFLVAYFVFYVVLLIALAVAAIGAAASGGGDCDCDCGGCDCDGCDCGGCDACGDCGSLCTDCHCGCVDCGPCGATKRKAYGNTERRALRREHRETRIEKRLERKRGRIARRKKRLGVVRANLGLSPEPAVLGLTLDRDVVTEKPGRIRLVHDFIFGAAAPPIDHSERDRNIIGYIRDHAGRITASDTASLTGLPLEQADALTLDLCARYEGDIEVTEDGAIVYTFDALVTTAGEHLNVLDWLQDQMSVTVERAARQWGVDASEARRRLEAIERQGGGHFEHDNETRFVVDDDNLNEHIHNIEGLRDYTYVWERLESSPAVLGVPDGSYTWLVVFNGLNLTLATIVTLGGGLPGGFELLASSDAVVFGSVPLVFSALVFVIPLVRTIVRAFADRIRLRRNAWRVFLLALFHRLEDHHDITAQDVLDELSLGSGSELKKAATRMLEKAVKRYDGSVDPEGYTEAKGHVYTFDRVHHELASVAHERLSVDLDALRVKKIVYDSSK